MVLVIKMKHRFVGLVSLLFLVSCGKQVSGGRSYTNTIEGPLGGVSGGGSADATADAGEDWVSAYESLKSELDTERQAREAEDAKIREGLNALRTDLETLEKEIQDEITRLDVKDQQLEAQIAESNLSLTESMDSMSSAMKEEMDALKDHILMVEENARTAREAGLAKLEQDMSSYKTETDEKIKAAMDALAKLNDDLTASNAERDAKIQEIYDLCNQKVSELRADINLNSSDIDKLEAKIKDQEAEDKRLADLIQQNSQTSASNTAAIAANTAAIANINVLNQTLQKAIDKLKEEAEKQAMTDADLQAQIDELIEEHSAMKEQVKKLKKQYQSLAWINDYKEQIKGLSKVIDGISVSISNLNSDLTDLSQASEEIKQKIAEMDAEIDTKADKTTLAKFKSELKADYRKAMAAMEELRMEMNAGDAQIDQKIATTQNFLINVVTTDQSLRDKINETLKKMNSGDPTTSTELAKEFNQLVKEVNAEKSQLKSQMESFAEELKQVKLTAEEANALAEANEVKLKELTAEMEAARQEIKQAYETSMEALLGPAASLIAKLGPESANRLAKAANNLAKANQKALVNDRKMIKLLRELNPRLSQEDATKIYIQDLKPLIDQSYESNKILRNSLVNLRQSFFRFLGAPNAALPFYMNPNANPYWMLQFRSVMAYCGGTPSATFANALGFGAETFLLHSYVYDSVFGMYRNYYPNLVYIGSMPASTLKSYLVATLQYPGAPKDERCFRKIRHWANKIWYHSRFANYVSYAQIVWQQQAIQRNVVALHRIVRDLLTHGSFVQIDKIIEEQRKLGRQSKWTVKKVHAKVASIIKDGFEIYQARNSAEKIIADFEKILKSLCNDAACYGQIQTALQEFRDAIEQVSVVPPNMLGDAKEELMAIFVSLLTETTADMGFEGQGERLAELLKKQIDLQDLDTSDINTLWQPKIAELQYFFDHPDSVRKGEKCDPGEIVSGGGVHSKATWGSWNECFVNLRAKRSKTQDHVNGFIDSFKLRAFGSMHKMQVNCEPAHSSLKTDDSLKFNKTFDFSVALYDGVEKKRGTYSNGVFDVSGGDCIAEFGKQAYQNGFGGYKNNYWDGVQVTATPIKSVEGLDDETGESKSLRVQLYSPIVLDFINVGMVQTIDPSSSGVRFDLDNDGVNEQTGWVDGSQAGFLALDLNGNGTIDSGAELFGQATKLGNGNTAQNGYEGLAMHDTNGDRFLDKKDAVFSELFVWFDKNSNGISEAGELKSLTEMKVSKIEISYKPVPKEKSFDRGNLLKYEGKFWGPESCGNVGCRSVDVFFGTTIEVSSLK